VWNKVKRWGGTCSGGSIRRSGSRSSD
jgi:hypothetical protein